MTQAERFAEIINGTLPRVKQGALRFFGVWFGRPFDNVHVVQACEADEEVLTLGFNEGEILSVWSPERLTCDESTFRIGNAGRVRWEWYAYGSGKPGADLCFLEFRRTERGITEIASFGHMNSSNPDGIMPAVEIL